MQRLSDKMAKSTILFKEIQRFNQPWIWLVLTIPAILVVGLFGAGINQQIIHGKPFGNHPMSDNGLIFSSILALSVLILLFLLFGLAKLTTVIDKAGVHYKFFPFHFKFRQISWDEIRNFGVTTYQPVRDYGGWGIRDSKKGKAYNVSGDKGLMITLKTGKQILIGTQNETGLSAFLEEYFKNIL